jgi:HEAT repeat protein
MLALGALHDELSALPLIEALQTDHPGERRTAFAALRQLSGCELPDRSESWRAWFRAEHAWWRGEAEATLERLRSEDDAEVVAAVRSLGERSLRRDELSLHLMPLLRTHPSPTVRRQVTLALARLGDPVALRALVMALEDPEEDVRNGAHVGLSSISGLSLPATSQAWTAALRGDD